MTAYAIPIQQQLESACTTLLTVNHQPKSNNKGHYTAVTKHQTTNSWFEYDDDDVHRINFVGRKSNFSAVRYQRMASILFFEIDKSV